MPESVAALRTALAIRIQTSLPLVLLAQFPIALGLDTKSAVLLLTLVVSVHLVIFAVYLFTTIGA